MEEKTLTQINNQKNLEMVGQLGSNDESKLDSLPSNYILNVINSIKSKQQEVWYDFELPSNGKCGYSKNIQLREMTTQDEKSLIKEMFNGKDNSLMNLIKKCARFPENLTFNFDKLTTFDQDFILLELSALTFPGEKNIVMTDEEGHKIQTSLNKDELILVKVDDNVEYPFMVELSDAGFIWYLEFMTIEKIKIIKSLEKHIGDDITSKILLAISQITNHVKIKDTDSIIQVDNFSDYIKLMEILKPRDIKILTDFYNDIKNVKYGYKLTKEFYCKECNKSGSMELEPLNFFRVTI